MQTVTYDIAYVEARDRKTVAFRIILAIPHLIITSAWGYLNNVITVIQWFIILFTGKRNKALFDFCNLYIAYSTRTTAYAGLMHDRYPAFAFTPDGANTPLQYSMGYEASANRTTSALRIIWAIPALIIMIVVGIAAFVVTIAAWFAIVFTGKMPRGMFDFLLKAHRYGARVNTYLWLLTDAYPKY